ncbi:MAG: hypothetical protein M1827_007641 [Pycnora praestabilis]|nr:MAG: hypothetical protein M1827_007641 [Pycnora praestabilis]
MFIATMFLLHERSQTYAVEAFLLIQITFTMWFVGTLDYSKFSRKNWNFSLDRIFIRDGAFVAMVAYNIWFWWLGLDLMQATPCGTFSFFFSKVNLDGWYRTANKVLSIVALCYNFSSVLQHFLCVLRIHYSRKIKTSEFRRDLGKSLCHDLSSGNVCQIFMVAEEVPDISNGMGLDLNPNRVFQHDAGPILEQGTALLRDLNQASIVLDETSKLSERGSLHEKSNIRIKHNPASSDGDTSMIPRSNLQPPRKKSDMKSSKPFLPSFEELYSADSYLYTILATVSTDSHQTNRWQMSFLKGSVKLYIPHINGFSDGQGTAFSNCLPDISTIIHLPYNNIKTLAIVISHIYALQRYQLFHYPQLIHTALRDLRLANQDWRILIVMADIRMTREPKLTRRLYWVPLAIQTGIVCIGLVVSIELTLYWNHITGVNDIGSLGQLIPSILGLGGLVKVLWLKAKRVWKGLEDCEEEEMSGEDDGLADAYYRRKEVFEREDGLELGAEEA